MAFGIDDIAKWVDNLRRSFAGGTSSGPNAIGNQNIQSAIVNPLKMGADFTGVTQGVKGMSPDASALDKALSLLILTGAMTGPEFAGEVARKSPGIKNSILDVIGPKVEMFHGSSTSDISKLMPKIAPAAGTAYGKPSPYVYLASPEDAMKNLMAYLKPSGMKSLEEDTRAVTGSIYRTKVPKHRLEEYGSGITSHWGKRSAVPVRVVEELKASNTPMVEFRKSLEEFVKRTK